MLLLLFHITSLKLLLYFVLTSINKWCYNLTVNETICLKIMILIVIVYLCLSKDTVLVESAPLAQLVEQLTLNQWAQGSSPWRCTRKKAFDYRYKTIYQRLFLFEKMICNCWSVLIKHIFLSSKCRQILSWASGFMMTIFVSGMYTVFSGLIATEYIIIVFSVCPLFFWGP